MDNYLKVLLPKERVARRLSVSEFQELLGVTYSPQLRFLTEEVRQYLMRARPYFLRLRLAGVWGERRNACLERIATGYEADVTVRWIGEILGYGLYNNRELEEGEYIGEYTGLVRPLSQSKPDHNAYCLHYPTRFWSNQLFAIDSANEGNCMRFSNHSDKPKMELECVLDRQGIIHFVLLAKCFLPRGTHLTFDYGASYWKYRESLLF